MIEKLVLSSQRGVNQLTLQLQLAAYFLPEADAKKAKKAARAHPVGETQAGVEG
jgi:hypothetical protein